MVLNMVHIHLIRFILIHKQMKNLFKISTLIGIIFVISLHDTYAQNSSEVKQEYNNLEDALRNPNKVYRLNLSNQSFNSYSDSI